MNHILLQLLFTILLAGQEKELVSIQVDQDEKLNIPAYNWELARNNGVLANEGFERSNRSMHTWEKHRHGESLLYGDRIIEGDKYYELWLPKNAAADCYPFHVLTAALTDQKMLEGEMTSMLHSEIEHTSRDLGDGKHILPDVWNIANHRFESKEADLFEITFGVSEYCKDGLMPISEWMGTNTAWYERMISMTDYMWENHAIGKSDFGEDIILADKDLSSRHNVEAHGEQLQVLPRLFWATGDEKYREWAIRLGDHYLLGKHHPTEDLEYLRLRDHGNEIISGLTELYATLSILKHPKAKKYRAPLYRMLDKVLEAGRNEDGLFHDNLYPLENKRSGRVADNFGYVYNAFYIAYMIDRISSDADLSAKVENYRHEMIRGLENLDQEKYYNFTWEGQSSDGYADALEGAINLYNREPLSRLAKWIDSEMQVLWAFQGEKGYSQKIYPDGNFCRTSLMYSLWKTQGIHTKEWRKDLEFGATKTPDGSGIIITVVAKESDWDGSLVFDQPRHLTYFNMPVDYPRINSFSEWFTVDVDKEYKLIELDNEGGQNIKFVEGAGLINGISMNLKAGEEKRYIIEKTNSKNRINVYCNEHNDLYQLLKSNGHNCVRYDNINNALESCKKNEVLLILAKNYPVTTNVIPGNFYRLANKKNLKTYIEFPDHLESGLTGEIKTTKKERLVVTSDFFGEKLSPKSILDAGLYAYVDVPEKNSHMKGANVAGFDKAVYGLENTPNSPVLFEEGNFLILTTKLSDFNKSRYSPVHAWESAIGGILSYLSIEMKNESLKWEPIIKPTYTAIESLPENAYDLAVERGANWYKKGRFLIHSDWKNHWQSIDTLKLPVGPPMDLSLPSGDGSLGVMEGHYSYINFDGSQPYRYWLRGDCVAETAMTFAIANCIKKNTQNEEIAKNLMDFLFNSDVFKTSNSKDPKMSSYGLIGWAATHPSRYYGDDNARILLGSILSSQMMENNKWDTQILELILANFRTSGRNGFRGGALNGEDIDEKTWQTLMRGEFENIAPHYESWLWATYLWLYDKTGYQPLLLKAKNAIEITMTNYPNNWKWTNGIQQERARMILPLAWLVRVEDTKEHRDWLNTICDDLLKLQVETGALREELGEGSKGRYGAPKSNKNYGHAEAPVIHTNGEPIADMLYTSNFAFFALNEAAQATQNPIYIEAVDKLAEFLVRIQSSSSGPGDLDGCWFRAFDYKNWEYYGSNADHGWGAWGTLTGWTQSFITTTLALKLKETSYWDITKDSGIGNNIDDVWPKMLPGFEH